MKQSLVILDTVWIVNTKHFYEYKLGHTTSAIIFDVSVTQVQLITVEINVLHIIVVAW